MELRNQYPEMNLGVSGPTGSGKTVFASKYAFECNSLGYINRYFTNKLSDAVKLSKIFNPDAIIFTLSQSDFARLPSFLINPFIPPKGCTLESWMRTLANLYGSVSRFMDGGIRFMRNIFLNYIEHLSKDSRETFTLLELYRFYLTQEPDSRSGEKEKWLRGVDVLKDHIHFIGMDAAQNMVDGYSMEDLAHQNIVFVLPDNPTPIHTFLCALPYIYLIELRDKNPSISRHKILFLYEEAHNLFPKQFDRSEHPILSECARKGRFVNCCLAFTSHTTSLDPLLLNNLYCQVFKPMSNPDDIHYVSKTCNFTKKQFEDYLYMDRSYGIVKLLGHPAYKVKFDNFQLPDVDYE